MQEKYHQGGLVEEYIARMTDVLNRVAINIDIDINGMLESVAEHTREEWIYCPVLGRFNAGKSSLINLLLREDLLPVSFIPLTGLPVSFFHGKKRQAFVEFSDGATDMAVSDDPDEIVSFVSSYASEKGNPRNIKSVRRIFVYHPSSILENGTVLIDTSGFEVPQGIAVDAMLDSLPGIDAVFFIIAADALISLSELSFIRSLFSLTTNVYFILTKMDLIENGDRTRVVGYIRKTLTSVLPGGSSPVVFPVSLVSGRRIRTDTGLPALESYILEYLGKRKRILKESAALVKISAIRENIGHIMSNRMDAVFGEIKKNEVAESEIRICIDEIDRLENDLPALIEGDYQKIEKHTVMLTREITARLFERVLPLLMTSKVDARHIIIGLFDDEWGKVIAEVDNKVSDFLLRRAVEVDSMIKRLLQSMQIAGIDGQVELFSDYWRTAEKEGRIAIERWNVRIPERNTGILDRLFRWFHWGEEEGERIRMVAHGIVNENVENMRWVLCHNCHVAIQAFRSAFEFFFRSPAVMYAREPDRITGRIAAMRSESERQIASLELALMELQNIGKDEAASIQRIRHGTGN
jgi:GTP-binding protein EngB required for normal cell division